MLRGIWPEYQGSLHCISKLRLLTLSTKVFPAPASSKLLSAIQSTDEWHGHLSVTQTLRSRLATMFNANTSSWMSTVDHFADNFQARLCNGYQLPCSHLNESDCVTLTRRTASFALATGNGITGGVVMEMLNGISNLSKGCLSAKSSNALNQSSEVNRRWLISIISCMTGYSRGIEDQCITVAWDGIQHCI